MTQVLNKNKKVLLGLSGGVDSTAATLLLKNQGYEVIGMFFDALGNQTDAINRAEKTAKELGIEFIHRDVSKEFSSLVIDYFCNAYLCGETPNPCVMCNPTIKFKTMLEEANRIGADFLATGHYAQVFFDEKLQRYFIKKAENERKDQSYMLYRLGQDVLSRLLLPLGTICDKELTRDLVREKGIHNADTKDSQEICFIKDDNYIDYIKNRQIETGNEKAAMQKGNFIDKDGNKLGEHQGIVHYTIGQRKGLGITFGKPVFVTNIDKGKNTVTLGSNEDLFTHDVLSENNIFTISFLDYKDMPKEYEGKKITAKIRYAAKPAEATLHREKDGRVLTHFVEAQRAITPGQSIVFYDGEIVIGGGIICS